MEELSCACFRIHVAAKKTCKTKAQISIYENKRADQLGGNNAGGKCLCFRFKDSRIPLLTNSKLQASKPLLILFCFVVIFFDLVQDVYTI